MAQVKLVTERQKQTQEQIFKILFENDEVSWKTIIFNLIDMEQMDPWDISVSLIAEKFLELVRTLKEMDFRITGKIVLASAILLKLKSSRLVEEDMLILDKLINEAESSDEEYDLFGDEFPMEYPGEFEEEKKEYKLIPRTPQPRSRKVSVYDLVEALEKALNVSSKRQVTVKHKHNFRLNERMKTVDMSVLMKDMYQQIDNFYEGKTKKLSWQDMVSFTDILPSESKEDKVLTFIPLLHLDGQRKIELLQREHFGDINIQLLKKFEEKEVIKAS